MFLGFSVRRKSKISGDEQLSEDFAIDLSQLDVMQVQRQDFSENFVLVFPLVFDLFKYVRRNTICCCFSRKVLLPTRFHTQTSEWTSPRALAVLLRFILGDDRDEAA